MLVVVTAPGADVLPWDTRRCAHLPKVKCSGKLGCRVDARARYAWESDVQKRWSNCRQAISMRMLREGFSSPLLAYGDEDQLRGAWHRNLLLEAGPAGNAYLQHLRELAPRYGFGFVDGRPRTMTGIQASSYMSGYITNAGGKKGEASMQAIARRVNSSRRVWYVSTRLTGDTRVTMGTLRAGRRCWAASQGLVARPTEGFAVVDWLVIDCATGAILRAVWDRERSSNSASRLSTAEGV